MDYYAGIDVGGTKINSIIIDEKYKIIGKYKMKTGVIENINDLAAKIYEAYLEALKNGGINNDNVKAVGVAVPSSVDIENGILIYAPNLNLKNIKMHKPLFEKFNKPVFIDNDGNLGAFGEYFFNKDKNIKNFYGIFAGTGIGGGYVFEGKIVRGINYTAGEIGHMIIKMNGPECGCGRSGCLEAVAGKIGIINYIKKFTKKNKYKTLLNNIDPDWKKNTHASRLKECFLKNDKAVIKAVSRAAEAIGIASANLVNILGIDAIVLGGGIISEFKDEIMPVIKKNIIKYSISGGSKHVKIFAAALGDNAVSMGAAAFVSLKENEDLLYKNKLKRIS